MQWRDPRKALITRKQRPKSNAKVRLWKYPHTPDDELLVRRFAAAQKLPVFTGRVKSPEFHELMVND